jgi:hypothetical protein
VLQPVQPKIGVNVEAKQAGDHIETPEWSSMGYTLNVLCVTLVKEKLSFLYIPTGLSSAC